jgi:hypothetical protein
MDTKPQRALTIFGREPAAWLGLIEAALALFVAFPIAQRAGIDSTFVVLFMAVVSAAFGVYTAFATKDQALGYIVGLVKAGIALAAYFRLELSPEQTALVVAFVAVAVGFFQRSQTSPVVDSVVVSPSPTPVVLTSEAGVPADPTAVAAALAGTTNFFYSGDSKRAATYGSDGYEDGTG